MAEYTDLGCDSPEVAQKVLDYLKSELAQDEEPINMTAYVVKATVRITYHDMIERWEREGWDRQLIGFRDGLEAT